VIDSISGEIVRVGSDHVVLDTNGIAYLAFCPAGTLRSCREGTSILIYMHLIVRDDTIQLYGFADPSEREIFRHLLTVGQVGPKLALQILSDLPGGALIEAIATNDVHRLTAIKGIGRKTAERILVDLRDRVGDLSDGAHSIFLLPEEETALKALTSKALGFSAREARQTLERLRGDGLGAEGLVRRALELLGSAR
jgi:Holliday junction DNA helicase RuvA